MKLLNAVGQDRSRQDIALAHCKNNIVDWFNDWVWTFDPRLAGDKEKSPRLPFVLFPRQVEFLDWLAERVARREEGVSDKSRDVGVTYLCAGFALHRWRFFDGFKTTFGSRKAELVDKLGDPDSIFEKLRIMLRSLPVWMLPAGFSFAVHDLHMRLVNPVNGNVITGEGGDDMGRGGRSSLYVVDEAAYLERAEKVDAALAGNTDTAIWVSSVNGMGNLFARKRHGGKLPVFTFHLRDDPRKTPEWIAEKKRKTDPVVWASEYDIDYSASVEGICIPASWVQSAVELGRGLYGKIEPSKYGVGGLDVGGGGKAKSVFSARFGAVVRKSVSWGNPDTIETAGTAVDEAKRAGVRFINYDNVGVGLGVASALPRLAGTMPCFGINAGDPPTKRVWPDGRRSDEMFVNLKAELWTIAREAFKRTHECVLFLRGVSASEGAQQHPVETLVVLDPEDFDLISQLSLPRRFRTEKGLMQMESKEQLRQRGIASPDHAEAFILTWKEPGPRATGSTGTARPFTAADTLAGY